MVLASALYYVMKTRFLRVSLTLDKYLILLTFNINIWFPHQVPSQSYGQMEAWAVLDTALS